MPYSFGNINDSKDVSIIKSSDSDTRIDPFSKDLCVFSENVANANVTDSDTTSKVLINLNSKECLYSKNAFERLYPASLTKIMTALVALNYSNTDDIITCTDAVENIDIPGAMLLGLKKGDTLTMDQALRLALISSYNDVAVAIAVHVGGDVENFCNMMNETALSIGAIGTRFTNPHGLTDPLHYTTSYDIYLIFNEALKKPEFLEIIQSTDYSTIYHDRNGNEVEAHAGTTNGYLSGYYDTPDNITVIGGKTGTTDEAGYCLALYSRSIDSNPYISIILQASSRENLYSEMNNLLTSVN